MKNINDYLKEGAEYTEDNYKQFRVNNSKAFIKFIKANPEFDNEEFKQYVIQYNKADCDAGELNDIGPKEIKRLGSAFRWN
jgi:hypothetical protein